MLKVSKLTAYLLLLFLASCHSGSSKDEKESIEDNSPKEYRLPFSLLPITADDMSRLSSNDDAHSYYVSIDYETGLALFKRPFFESGNQLTDICNSFGYPSVVTYSSYSRIGSLVRINPDSWRWTTSEVFHLMYGRKNTGNTWWYPAASGFFTAWKSFVGGSDVFPSGKHYHGILCVDWNKSMIYYGH